MREEFGVNEKQRTWAIVYDLFLIIFIICCNSLYTSLVFFRAIPKVLQYKETIGYPLVIGSILMIVVVSIILLGICFLLLECLLERLSFKKLIITDDSMEIIWKEGKHVVTQGNLLHILGGEHGITLIWKSDNSFYTFVLRKEYFKRGTTRTVR